MILLRALNIVDLIYFCVCQPDELALDLDDHYDWYDVNVSVDEAS